MSEVPYTRLPRTTLWLLRPDEFTMGGDQEDEQPAFEAEVRAIYISKAPITNEEFEVFDPSHLRQPSSTGNHDPVVGVSFKEAWEYCEWYSQATGKKFRLPTEVEWEFSCRGSCQSRFPWGDEPIGAAPYVWDAENSDGRTHAIEQLQSNGFGLYDMLGNVWEWTSSLYRPYPIPPQDHQTEGPVPGGGPRAARGGSFRDPRGLVGSATRSSLKESTRRDDLGFRIVRLL